VYVVAKSTYTSTLRAGLGASTEDLTIVPQVRSTDYATYTAVITSTMPVVASLLAVTTTGGIDIDFFCVYHPEDVPEGEWSNGADGDTECIEPVSPVLALPGGDDSDELGLLEWIKAVLVYIWDWIKVIWEWIDYGICLMVLWLRKIWLALDAMLSGLVVTLGLDQPVQFLYDWLMVSGYVLDLMLQLAERLFAILGRAMTLVFTPFAFIALGLGFLATLLGSFWDAFSTPCDPLSLPVPTPVIKGFVLVMSLIEQIDTIGVVTSFLIGLMGIAMVIWTVGQFRNFAGGSSE